MSRSSSSLMIVSSIVLVLSVPAASAQTDPPGAWWDERPGPQLELFLSSLFASSATDGSLGLRGAFHLSRRFALEGSLSRIADDDVDLWLADVSAKYYYKNGERTGLYLLGGPGLFLSDELDADEPMLHFGLGAEIGFGRRFYLRPELRGRWFADDVDAVNIGDLSVGFGWRF